MSDPAGDGMSKEDFDKCRLVANNLKSEKYKKYNYLFIDPFDLASVPGYLDVVDKKLDVSTLASNLEAGLYKTRKDFFDDASLIFQNAIKYHGSRETKWITKPAKEMLKVVQKEMKNVDKRPSKILTKQKPGSLKLKLGSKKKDASSSVAAAGAAAMGVKLPSVKAEEGTLLMASAGAVGTERTTSVAAPSATEGTAKPKVTLKLKTTTNKSKEKTAAAKAKSTQPKLKLKLSLSKKVDAPPPPAAPSEVEKEKPKEKPEKKKSKKANQIKLNMGARGKELPKGVTAATTPTAPEASAASSSAAATTKKTKNGSTSKTTKKGATKKTTTKKVKKSVGPASSVIVPPPPTTIATGGAASMMTPIRKIQCSKVLSGLKRRKTKSISWFLLPVSDKNIIQDYRAKIKQPMCISVMQNKLDKNEYRSVAQFALDLRRIFANCLRFNTSMKDRLRPIAAELLETAEDLMVTFLIRDQKPPPSNPAEIYPPLLYCWQICIRVLNTLFNLTNPGDGQPTVLYFLHPVTMYCGGQYPPDYLKLVKKPMDFGTITSNLMEGVYQTVDEFAADCRLVIENCKTFYGGREDGKIFIDQADYLNKTLTQQLDAVYRYTKSPSGLEAKSKAVTRLSPNAPPLFPKPPPQLLLSILQDLRGMSYTDKATKITEPAMGPFEKPISLTDYPDYMQFVQTPIDLQSIEKKVNSGFYETPEDFEYDMTLMFKNCEAYNLRKGDHLVAMAKYGAKQFRRLFTLKMRSFEDPSSVTVKEEPKEALSINPNKKPKVEAGGVSKGKTVPRISITAAQVSSAAAAAAKAAKMPTTNSNKNRSQNSKANQPVPLHIAIARVKEAYPLRRAHKSLQTWEADCARFFKELMKHPWISAARPKFIFHVPVPVLFPELKEAYMMKIRKPMDLTTVECNLLEGNRYSSADDFVQDVALVFSNAITFNRDGRDLGDPLSCAYYDASIHLLRYSRWLSLELLSSHVADIDSVDEGSEGIEKLPPLSWKLTAGNRTKARTEMENLVLNEPIEKSVEGDRFTWMEAECEKLLKALRHQSDLRQMTFFIAPNYPPDYAAFISKPMDWEKVSRTLKQREYDTFGEIIADLRLIFSNALKYNARLQGTETVSGRAYEAAKYMSAKLEAAINKMMLSVSDRLERERIDHANAEREIEAAERAEEAAIRATWKKEASTDGSAAPVKSDATVKIRAVRKKAQRRESTDFEIPFFDEEDDGQHERSYFDAVKQQKALFEKQRQDLAKMRQGSMATGAGVFARLLQRQKAKKWLAVMQREKKRKADSSMSQDDPKKSADCNNDPHKPSSVLTELEKEGRNRVQMKLAPTAQKKKRKRPRLAFN